MLRPYCGNLESRLQTPPFPPSFLNQILENGPREIGFWSGKMKEAAFSDGLFLVLLVTRSKR
jgi:hypothetical protein